jgi:hypothetical protein
MKKFKIKAQGYGGSGPSIAPYISTNVSEIKSEIASLIVTDHAVQLYEIDDNGSEKRIDFEYYTSVTIEILQDE